MTKYREVDSETSVHIDVECCDHCHGDPEDCPGAGPDTGSVVPNGTPWDPITIDTVIDYLLGRISKADLVREVLKRRPHEIVTP